MTSAAPSRESLRPRKMVIMPSPSLAR
jgi:hypothetical protein